MTYKSTRAYDFRLLDRHIDFDGLIAHAMASLNEFANKSSVDGYIGCTLSLIYPDLEYVDPTKGGWDARVTNLTERVHRRFSDIDWEITSFKGKLFESIDWMRDALPHRIMTAVRKNKYQLQREIEVAVPCKDHFANTMFVLNILLKLITPEWFQYAASASLRTWIVSSDHPSRLEISHETAEKVPWKYWLRLDNRTEAVNYYSTPGIAETIADQCKGFFLAADKAEVGEKSVRRYTYDFGDPLPLQVNDAEDLRYLVNKKDFYAFYTSVENIDNMVGKVCIDLDARWLLSTVLGPERTWHLECILVDAILALATYYELPLPAIKFSGSRGIHAYWSIAPHSLGRERMTIDPYLQTMYEIDEHIDRKKTTESFLSPFNGMKLITQALLLEAKHKFMDWTNTPLSPKVLDALDISQPPKVITVGGFEDRHPGRLSVDIICQRKGVFRSVLSPHYKTGLVSRDISNEFGHIGAEYRLWGSMRKLASILEVQADIERERARMTPNPGTLTRNDITTLAERLSGVIATIAKFSPHRASDLSSEQYRKYTSRYELVSSKN